MARQPDLGRRTVSSRQPRRLWKKGAGRALTMRAVARAARTDTHGLSPVSIGTTLRALLQQTRKEWLGLV